MTLDMPTAALLAGTGALLVTVLMAAIARTMPLAHVPGLRLLMLGMAMYGGSFLVVAFRGHLPAWWPPVISNGLLVASFVPCAVVLRRLHGVDGRAAGWIGLALTAFCVAENAWLYVQGETANLRIVLNTLCQATASMLIAVVPLQVRRGERNFGLNLIAIAFGGFGLILLHRALAVAFGPPVHSVMEQPALQVIVYFAGVMLPLVVTVGFVQMYAHWALKEFKHAANVDYLTGCLNRRSIEAQACDRIAAARRRGRGLALLSMDLDRLKQVNDSEGHGAGDRLLQGLVSQLGELLGSQDLLARIGGDEFVVLLDGARREDAHQFAADLRGRLAEEASRGRRISVSIGVAVLESSADDFGAMLQRADVAMYADKVDGRGEAIARRS